MKLIKDGFFILILIGVFVSCNNDDNSGLIEIEIRDRNEQQVADKDSLVKYFNTHYYNSDEVNALLPSVSVKDIVITNAFGW